MAVVNTYKCLGQANLTDVNTDAVVYTAPSPGGAIISTVVIANRTSTDSHVTVFAAVGAESLGGKNLLMSGRTVPANGFITITEGITLGPGDKLYVTPGAAMSVNVFGTEQTSLTTTAPKILGRIDTVAGSLVDVYTVPLATSAVISSIFVTMFNGSNFNGQVNMTTRLAVSVGGGVIDLKDYLMYDYVMTCRVPLPFPEQQHLALSLGLTLAAGDKIRWRHDPVVVGDGAEAAINVFGIEMT